MPNLLYKSKWNISTPVPTLIEERQRYVQFIHDLDIEIGQDSENWSYSEINEAIRKREHYIQHHRYLDTLISTLQPTSQR